MLTKKMVRIPASRIPDGTLYGLASYVEKRPYALNRAEVSRGTVKVLQAEGDTAFLTFVASVDSSGRKIVVFPTVSDPATHLLTVTTGNKVFLGKELTKGLYSYAFHSLSPDGRSLAYAWTKDNSTARERKRTYGLGVYDTVSQQKWEQAGAFFPAWSASGRHFVFARFFLTDGPLPEPSKTPASPASDNRKGSRRTDASIVDELYYFAKDVRSLSDAKAERISQKRAVHLAGRWYRSALTYALNDGSRSFDSLTSGAAVAPGGRGAVLIDSFNRKTNDPPDQPQLPLMP